MHSLAPQTFPVVFRPDPARRTGSRSPILLPSHIRAEEIQERDGQQKREDIPRQLCRATPAASYNSIAAEGLETITLDTIPSTG